MMGFNFSIPLTVRSSELNYGGHVGYQHFLTYFREARIAYLGQWGYSELGIEGIGMMVGEANCRYKKELFLNDAIEVGCRIAKLKSKRLTFQYRIERAGSVCAEGFTNNLSVDYAARKVVALPKAFVRTIRQYEHLE